MAYKNVKIKKQVTEANLGPGLHPSWRRFNIIRATVETAGDISEYLDDGTIDQLSEEVGNIMVGIVSRRYKLSEKERDSIRYGTMFKITATLSREDWDD